ncbi:MAG: carbohydrate-binding family 9-like protein [Chthoniobacteraceae bacterium]
MKPVLTCAHRLLGELSADENASQWRGLPGVCFAEALTGAAPKQGTEVRAAWSDDEWRLLFVAEDADPWATMIERDAPLYEEETVEVFLDPVGDLESYFEIEVNPLGTVLDLVFRKSRSGYKGDRAWECEGLRTLVRKHSKGWSAELAIPFVSVTNSAPFAGSRWRANFCRIDRPSRDVRLPRELTAWSPPLRASFHTPERFGIVEFVG